MTFEENDVVKLMGKTEDGSDVPLGTQGYILLVYPGYQQYEVEFQNEKRRTIAVSTVTGDNLTLVRSASRHRKTA